MAERDEKRAAGQDEPGQNDERRSEGGPLSDEAEERVLRRFRHTDLEHPLIRELLAQSRLRANRSDD